jgi:cell division protease FtsH
MVLELVEKETLAKDDLERILGPVRKRPPHNTFTAFGKRTPSDRPPVEIPPSLRKPSPIRTANGSPNGAGEQTEPETVPEPATQPSAPGPGATFGPQQGTAGHPYGGYPPPPGTHSDAGGNRT